MFSEANWLLKLLKAISEGYEDEHPEEFQVNDRVKLNLDGMEPYDLLELGGRLKAAPSYAKFLFPSRPKGYLRVTKDVGNVLQNYAVYLMHDKNEYFDIAFNIYNKLPDYAKSVIKITDLSKF